MWHIGAGVARVVGAGRGGTGRGLPRPRWPSSYENTPNEIGMKAGAEVRTTARRPYEATKHAERGAGIRGKTFGQAWISPSRHTGRGLGARSCPQWRPGAVQQHDIAGAPDHGVAA